MATFDHHQLFYSTSRRMSGYDSDNEEQREYFYDLVMCAPKVEDVLSQLCGSRVVSFWKQRLKCSQLSHDEIDSLLDPNVVDWFHFHTGYLESICNRQATSKSNACERSHDQIDDLFQLAKDLQRAQPENMCGSSSNGISKNIQQQAAAWYCRSSYKDEGYSSTTMVAWR